MTKRNQRDKNLSELLEIVSCHLPQRPSAVHTARALSASLSCFVLLPFKVLSEGIKIIRCCH